MSGLPPLPELNRLLLVLQQAGGKQGLARKALREIATAFSLGGKPPDLALTQDFAIRAGFVRIAGGRLAPSQLGYAFLALNPEDKYEVTEAQRAFVARHCVFQGPLLPSVKRILGLFKEDHLRQTYVCDLAGAPLESAGDFSVISFMRAAGVLMIEDSLAAVARDYLADVSFLRVRGPLSPEELEEALRRQRERGMAAEEWVMGFEKKRLHQMNCEAEGDAVQHVSKVDVCAGFDIASFDGETAEFRFNRFIEVKSTSGALPSFVWSRNEVATARRLRKKYWLYLLTNFGIPGLEPSALLIQDPASSLGADGSISLECIEYRALISERM